MRYVLTIGTLAFAHVLFGVTAASAQTTVQLPTLRTFGVQTTVSVPDSGSAHLGGVTSARVGRTSQGVPILGGLPGIGRPFNNVGRGSGFTSNQSRVHAQIIDLREMDAAILEEARRARRSKRYMDPELAFLMQHMGRTEDKLKQPAASRSVNRQSPDSAQPLPVVSSDRSTQRLLNLGDQALQSGDYELATKYYAAAEQQSMQDRGPTRLR